jgi:hypothetical protein
MSEGGESNIVMYVVGGVLGLGVVGVVGWFAVGWLTAPGAGGQEEWLEELQKNVDSIAAAEKELTVVDDYRKCSSELEAKKSATPTPHAWQTQKCWTKIGWEPDDDVRGGYWVVLTEAGFEVHGVMDADQDGAWAHFKATEVLPAQRISAKGTY